MRSADVLVLVALADLVLIKVELLHCRSFFALMLLGNAVVALSEAGLTERVVSSGLNHSSLSYPFVAFD